MLYGIHLLIRKINDRVLNRLVFPLQILWYFKGWSWAPEKKGAENFDVKLLFKFPNDIITLKQLFFRVSLIDPESKINCSLIRLKPIFLTRSVCWGKYRAWKLWIMASSILFFFWQKENKENLTLISISHLDNLSGVFQPEIILLFGTWIDFLCAFRRQIWIDPSSPHHHFQTKITSFS